MQTPPIPTDKDSKPTKRPQSTENLVADPIAAQKKPSQALQTDTKDGKSIVTSSTAAPSAQPPSTPLPSDNRRVSSLEFETKKGKLVVTATTEGDGKKLHNVVFERKSNEQPGEKSKTIQSNAEKVVAAIDEINAANAAAASVVTKPVVKARRERVDFNRSSLERNFITPARAMSDFLLKMSDLDSLPKTKRRSPYEQEPPIVVYWRKDVEAKAIEVWGSRENLLRECLNREIERKRHQQSE